MTIAAGSTAGFRHMQTSICASDPFEMPFALTVINRRQGW